MIICMLANTPIGVEPRRRPSLFKLTSTKPSKIQDTVNTYTDKLAGINQTWKRLLASFSSVCSVRSAKLVRATAMMKSTVKHNLKFGGSSKSC
jgi:hypothetical protein